MDKDKLAELIAAIEAERDALVQQANARINYLDGKRDVLKELAASLGAPTEAPEGATNEPAD